MKIIKLYFIFFLKHLQLIIKMKVKSLEKKKLNQNHLNACIFFYNLK